MNLVFLVFAIVGATAVLLRWSRAVFGATRYAIERYVARQVAGQRAQRGDISGMAEAEKYRRASSERQLRAFALLAFWSALLIAPLLVPFTLLLYALYSLLWFLPGTRSKRVTTT